MPSTPNERLVKKKLSQMAVGILNRTDLLSDSPKNAYYRRNGITCEIGNSYSEILNYLYENHYEDVVRILKSREIPSVDRINSTLGYTQGNIRIIPLSENIKAGLENAHEKRSKRVRISYINGDSYEFESVRKASINIGVGRNTLNAMLKGQRLNGRDFSITEIKEMYEDAVS